MNPCQLTTTITALAAWISERLDTPQLELWAAIFTQLGDTLATIAVQRQLNCDNNRSSSNFQNL